MESPWLFVTGDTSFAVPPLHLYSDPHRLPDPLCAEAARSDVTAALVYYNVDVIYLMLLLHTEV